MEARSMNNFLTPALRTACFLGASIFLALLFPTPTRAQAPVVIDFEAIQPALVFNQFASRGVTFNGPLARDFSPTPGFTRSGTKAVELCFAQEFCSAPLNVNFTAGQAHAKVWVGYSAQLFQAIRVRMQALDVNGVVVGQASVVLGPSTGPVPVQNPLEVNSTSANIRHLVVGFVAPNPGEQAFNNGLVIDDVEFGAAGPAPPCETTVRPSVSLERPPPLPQIDLRNEVQINEFILQGKVQTLAPLDEAKLTASQGFPANIRTLDLLTTIVPRNGGPFGATRVNSALFSGRNLVTVEVRNCAGVGTVSAVVFFNPIAPGTGFKLVGLEVNQATQTLNNSVPLIANKPTVVRVYLNVTGPTASIGEVGGALIASRPGGTIEVPLLRSTNVIRADTSTDIKAKRRDLTASLNFVLPPEWLRAGTLHLELSKLFIQGAESHLPCNGCGNVDEIGAPRFVQFRPTKTLNLVLAPYENAVTNTSPDILFSPMGALQWLNNVYPLAGSFPSSGSGIRLLRILPVRSMSHTLPADGGDFLDDLQDVMNDLQDQSGNNWPSDARLFAMVPDSHGGMAYRPGNVSYGPVQAVESGLVPEEKFERFGRIWSQEIAHNFGRKHVSTSHDEQPPSDPAFPFAHGGIGEPGLATITDYWVTQPPSVINPGTPAAGSGHAHDFMSYGPGSDEHTRSWVSPFTYTGLFKSFEQLGQTSAAAPPQRAEKLVVMGGIAVNGAVILRPFRRVVTEFSTGLGTSGEYSVELVGAGGQTLLSHRFDARENGGTGLPSFNEYVPWRDGTQLILIKRGKTVIARRSVSPHKPWVRVLTPKQGEVWGRKATITWEAGDEDKDSLTYTVLYNSGLDSIWLPIATGLTQPSATVDTNLLPGSPRARVRVRVTDGVNTAEAESEGTFNVPDKRPLVSILSLTNGQVLAPGANPEFIAAAYDPEDGMLTGESLTWTSDRDGLLGQGQCSSSRPLSRGDHIITLTATDSQGHSVRTRVNVIVSRERLDYR
jgi:hypothetical protein